MRGFGLRPRTWLHAQPLRPVDWLLIGLALAGVVGAISWRVLGGGAVWVPPYPF
jgi:energy-coupling factor transporter transmembrane protein EcfT